MKKVLWTALAVKSLSEVYNFTCEVWDIEIADNLLSQIDYRIDQVQNNPELAPKFENSLFRKLNIYRTVSIFYKLTENHIKLLLVWDNRQNPKVLKELLTSA